MALLSDFILLFCQLHASLFLSVSLSPSPSILLYFFSFTLFISLSVPHSLSSPLSVCFSVGLFI